MEGARQPPNPLIHNNDTNNVLFRQTERRTEKGAPEGGDHGGSQGPGPGDGGLDGAMEGGPPPSPMEGVPPAPPLSLATPHPTDAPIPAPGVTSHLLSNPMEGARTPPLSSQVEGPRVPMPNHQLSSQVEGGGEEGSTLVHPGSTRPRSQPQSSQQEGALRKVQPKGKKHFKTKHDMNPSIRKVKVKDKSTIKKTQLTIKDMFMGLKIKPKGRLEGMCTGDSDNHLLGQGNLPAPCAKNHDFSHKFEQ